MRATAMTARIRPAQKAAAERPGHRGRLRRTETQTPGSRIAVTLAIPEDIICKTERFRSRDEFRQRVQSGFGDIVPIDAQDSAHAVFQVLWRHIEAGELDDVRQGVPEDVRNVRELRASERRCLRPVRARLHSLVHHPMLCRFSAGPPASQ